MHRSKFNADILVRHFSPIADQKDCNSCLAISTCQVVSDRLRSSGVIGINDQLDYYDFARMIDTRNDLCERGINPVVGMRYMVTHGAKLMKAPLSFRIKSWVDVTDIETIKRHIDNDISLLVIIPLYKGFEYYRGNDEFIPYEIDQSMRHMLSIVGYVKNTDILILRNSYGYEFGHNGLIKMRYKYVHEVYAPII